MHSSISNSEVRSMSQTAAATAPARIVAPPVPERPLPETHFGIAGVVAVLVALLLTGGWEMYWRRQGAIPSYRNSESLWAKQRRRIDRGEGGATVLIGSSRTLSNINLDVWQKLDGRRPIQLALEGTSPMRVMEDLANDGNFRGRLIVGVSPMLFFSGFEYRKAVLDYYPKETPSQRWGQWLSEAAVEPYFAFNDHDFALFTVLKRQPWPARTGVDNKLEVRKLFISDAERNMHMWQRMEQDVDYQNLQKSIWAQNWKTRPGPDQVKEMMQARQAQLDRATAAVAKLKQRGVEVIFVLHPVDGEFREKELGFNARPDTWDPLLQRTGARGIHFTDHPELQGLNLPEWSHLATEDAKRYTAALYKLIGPPTSTPSPR
jgi:hypothetical protein